MIIISLISMNQNILTCKNFIFYSLLFLLLGSITSCENDLLTSDLESENLNQEVAKGTLSTCQGLGCEAIFNGSFELGGGSSGTFPTGIVDLWSGAYGTADRVYQYDGINPLDGSYLAHMQRYKGNPIFYESIYSEFLLKKKNSYCLDYSFRGNTLKMSVYTFIGNMINDLSATTPSYQSQLGTSDFPILTSSFSSMNQWKSENVSFTDLEGRLLFVPSGSGFQNPNRMLVDNLFLRCKYGYLDGITATVISQSNSGYNYQFNALLSENNPNLSYLWNITYDGTGIASQDPSPIVNLPFPGKKPYDVTACLSIRDIDGCCTDECITFTVGDNVSPPSDSICNYSVCLDYWINSCEKSNVMIAGPNGWHCLSCDPNPEVFLGNWVNNYLASKGYGPVNSSIVTTDDCQRNFIVECSPLPISISYACFNNGPNEGEKEQLKLQIFSSNCEIDCES